VLDLGPELARRPPAPADLAQPPKPEHEHGVVGQRLGSVESAIEQLVIAGGRKAETLPDGSFLTNGEFPALPLEIQQETRPLIERRIAPSTGLHRVHESRLATGARRSSTCRETPKPEVKG
jgi:hypothetical protein